MDVAGFEALRPYLFSVAYRMLGRATEAEDVVQDAWVRYQTAAPVAVDSLKAYLTTIVTRLCLDRLKSAHATREQYVGPWLPEPVLTDAPANPEQLMARYESITMGFLVLLETLSPPERAVFLLREVFDYDYDTIASMLDTTAANCRQLLSRAKSRIAEGKPRATADTHAGPDAHKRLVEAFLGSLQRGDAGELATMLADDVEWWADGGGKVAAAGRPLFGRESVLKLLLGIRRGAASLGDALSTSVASINGEPAIVVRVGDRIDSVYVCSIAGSLIAAVHAVRNPDKLQYLKGQLQG
jgi:RNA polymerase sigma-70 factor (ECF subfamily)